MESMKSFAEEEQARKLKRVFQIFSRGQEDWVVARDPDESAGDKEKDVDISA